MESIPKAENMDMDRISSLPNSIIGKILSYVPTKYAAATPILSTRWRNIFPLELVQPIKFELDDSLWLHEPDDDDDIELHTYKLCFIDFVDRLFNISLKDVPCIDSLALECNLEYGDAKIISWVCSALEHNVRFLQLKIYLDKSETFFRMISGCKTLEHLEFWDRFELCLPDDFCLPNLNVLDLSHTRFSVVNEKGSINELIAGCPVLEYLCLSSCDWGSRESVYIKSLSLKTLMIDHSWEGSTSKLKIDAPNLDALSVNDCAAIEYVITPFKSLLEVVIVVGPSKRQVEDNEDIHLYDESIAVLVSACSSTESLHLGGCTIQAVVRSAKELPPFKNLISLALGGLGYSGWKLLARLLCGAPKLEQLMFVEGFIDDEGGYADFEIEVSNTPVCVEMHLKMINFWFFEGKQEESKLLEYFLMNGKVLEEITLSCPASIDSILVGRWMNNSKVILTRDR